MKPLKPLRWIASSRTDLKSFHREVRRDIGYALDAAQHGKVDPSAKPLKGFGNASVMEIVCRHDTNAYRGVYTVAFEDVVYVLHCFQKKSKHGISTPAQEIDLIKSRLAAAKRDYQENK